MSTKFFCLLIGTLVLAQCILADSSEENDSHGSSEEKIDEKHLRQHVLKTYLKLIEKTVTSTKKHFEPIINDIETKKDTINQKFQEKLTELKTVWEKASTKTTTNTITNEEKHNKNQLFKEIGKIADDLVKIGDETKNPTEEEEKLLEAHDAVIKDLDKNVEKFVNWTVEETDKYWKGLSTAEQKEKQKLHDALTEIKNETRVQKKMGLFDRVFDLTDETKENVITW